MRDAPPLWWLHGFTQTGRSAHVFRSILAARRDLHSPDLPGHGTASAVHRTLDETADDLARDLPEQPVDLGGYSFGARVALHVALRHPTRVRRLVLLGATRGILDESERAARRARDEDLARHIEEVGADAFVTEWLASPMFRDLPRDDEERAARSTADAAGLAASLRLAGTGTQSWLGDAVGSLAPVVLCVAGAADERFAREAVAIARAAPSGDVALVPGATHAAHLHRPTWVASVVEHFLDVSVHERAGGGEEGPQ